MIATGRRRFATLAFAAVLALVTVFGQPAARADSEFALAQPTFYVIAPGNDANVSAIASAVVPRLEKIFNDASPGQRIWVIARLGWTPDDLYNQCANDPEKNGPGGGKVIGGLILDGTNSYVSGVNSYVLWTRAWSKVTTRAQMVACKPAGYVTPTITWNSEELSGYGSRNGFPIEMGVVTGLYFGSSNNSNARSIALGAGISAFDSTAAVPYVDPVDATRDAAHRAANDLIDKLVGSCKPAASGVLAMCVKMGLASPPPGGVPTATPSPKPTEQPS